MKAPTSGSMAFSTSSWCGKTIGIRLVKKETKVRYFEGIIGNNFSLRRIALIFLFFTKLIKLLLHGGVAVCEFFNRDFFGLSIGDTQVVF